MALSFSIDRFYRHRALDRKVIIVSVTDDKKPDDAPKQREFYWNADAYPNFTDDDLVAEVRALLAVPAEHPALTLPEMETV